MGWIVRGGVAYLILCHHNRRTPWKLEDYVLWLQAARVATWKASARGVQDASPLSI